jgi:hypothetical protein
MAVRVGKSFRMTTPTAMPPPSSMMVPELEIPPEKVDKETQMAVMVPRSSE